jgi:PD-(D/E)XK nuclease superfamily protein
MTTDQKGAIAETAIVQAAIKLGISVSLPVAPERYDFMRVQCKWAVLAGDVVLIRCYRSRRSGERLVVRSYTTDEIDAIAAYCADLDRCYYIPFDRFPRRRGFHLRLTPARNNQQRGILWADDFDFAATLGRDHGAIAQLGERLDGIQKVAGSSPAGSIE